MLARGGLLYLLDRWLDRRVGKRHRPAHARKHVVEDYEGHREDF